MEGHEYCGYHSPLQVIRDTYTPRTPKKDTTRQETVVIHTHTVEKATQSTRDKATQTELTGGRLEEIFQFLRIVSDFDKCTIKEEEDDE